MIKTGIVTYERKGYVAEIMLNRPEKLNAFNQELVDGLYEAWKTFENDDEARVAIISGNGRAFSAGADINDFVPVGRTVPGFGVEVTKPIIAAVNGYCIGVGLVIAFMSDIRIVSEDAQFSYPEAKVGITGGAGSILTEVIPQGIAMEMLLVGDYMSAQRAYEVGLANHVVPNEELMNKAREIANKIANNAPLVVNTLKKLARNTDIMKNAGIGNSLIGRLEASQDKVEGFKAFKEKRDPVFFGK